MTLIDQKPIASQLVPSLESPIGGSQRPVLARDADATYWMCRYVERAEHVARLLQVNSEILIEVGDMADDHLKTHWQSILAILSVDTFPEGLPITPRVAEHMTFSRENINSIVRCLTLARENARGIREVISSQMWEHLNMLYWSIRSDETATAFVESPDTLYRQIISGSMLFQGLTDQTLVHGQRWFFAQLGKLFERITVTCRILKTAYDLQHGAGELAFEAPWGNVHWTSVLRSCDSIEAYRRMNAGELDALSVTQFLVLDADFPRSIHYCVREAYKSIAAIRAAVRPRSVDPTERVLGRLTSRLEYAEAEDITGDALPQYMSRILENIAEAALSVQRSFFLH